MSRPDLSYKNPKASDGKKTRQSEADPPKKGYAREQKNNDVRMLATLTPERLWNVIPIPPFLRTLISIASCMTPPLKKSSSAMGANMTKVNISKKMAAH